MNLIKTMMLLILAGNIVNAAAASDARCYQEPGKRFVCVGSMGIWKLASVAQRDTPSGNCSEKTPTMGTTFGSISADCGHDTIHYTPYQIVTSKGGAILDGEISEVCVFPDPQEPNQYAFLAFKYTDPDIVDAIFDNHIYTAVHHRLAVSYSHNPEIVNPSSWQTYLPATIKTTKTGGGSTYTMVNEIRWTERDGKVVLLQRNNDLTWSVTMAGKKVATAAKCLMHSEYYSTGVQQKMQREGRISPQVFEGLPTY